MPVGRGIAPTSHGALNTVCHSSIAGPGAFSQSRHALLQGRDRGDALGANAISFRNTAEIRVLERNFMRLAEHCALEKCDHAVRFVVDQKDFYRQIILRQGGQLMLRVLEAAIAGDADDLARFTGRFTAQATPMAAGRA